MNEEPNEKKGFIGSFIRTMLLLISVVVITATATYFVTVLGVTVIVGVLTVPSGVKLPFAPDDVPL